MTENEILLKKVEQLRAWKKGKSFIAQKLDISVDEVEKLLSELKGEEDEPEEYKVEVDAERGTMKSSIITNFEPKSDKELADLHKVDLSKYKISSYWTKQRGDKFTSSLLCTLLKPSEFNEENFTKFLKAYKSPHVPQTQEKVKGETIDAEISLTDFHLDKLDMSVESVEERKKQYINILLELLSHLSIYTVNKIVFVIGNDFFHTDTYGGTTTNGTPVEPSTTWCNAYEEGFDLLVKAITLVKSRCQQVEVILVQGNHDKTKSYYLAHALEVYFSKDSIKFNRSSSNKKYTTLGKTFIGYHHGNTKIDDLPLIFATCPVAALYFGLSPFREVHTGDKHYYMTKEIKGVRVQQLPSLAGTDNWHNENNFVHNIRAGIINLYHPTKGKCGEFEARIIKNQ